jgi:hypothetical protein
MEIARTRLKEIVRADHGRAEGEKQSEPFMSALCSAKRAGMKFARTGSPSGRQEADMESAHTRMRDDISCSTTYPVSNALTETSSIGR